MGFASTYLEERVLFPEMIKEAANELTGIIVVIPSYNEPGICRLLDSLALCSEPDCKVEVIVVINAPQNASAECIENNHQTIKNLENWRENNIFFFRLFAIMAVQPSIPGWGVGLARKTGMDEALRRFDSINNPGGIILNLDADCLVEKNYFVAVSDELLKRKELTACSIYFEHPLSGNDFPENVYKSIVLYELHLRYYYQGLAFSGFPYVFHTIGSAFGVRASTYMKAGGMNRRQAGEDFYFIQKLVSTGGYFNLNTTTVYPSPRVSSRVPFGTGATIGKLMEMDRLTLLTYNLMAFKELRVLFESTKDIFYYSNEELKESYRLLPPGLRSFLNEQEWNSKVIEIKNNTVVFQSFKKRFFDWFNMFRVVKYLNFVHLDCFQKKPVDVSACELLENSGIIFNSKEPSDLLLYYRSMEKSF